jgi:hypothetical protein
VGKHTRLASLELGCDRGAQSGNCDSGYSCAYSSNISWRSPTTPMPKEVNPRIVFERLFSNHQAGEASDARARREFYQQSILDVVAEDAQQLRSRLRDNDQHKLDEYLTSVRELELRIARASQGPEENGTPEYPKPTGFPKSFEEHIRLMCDLLALALQADLTRIATFMYANEGSNRSYAFLEVPEGHHDLSHHGGDLTKREKIHKINHFHVSQFAYFVEKLKGIREGDRSLLDNCMVVYGSGISDGNRHNHDDLPILLAGRARGTIRPGRHVRYPKGTPLCNLFLSMLDRMDAPIDTLGDSTGRVSSLEG